MGLTNRLHALLALAPPDARAIHFADAWTTWGELADLARGLDEVLEGAGLGPAARVGVVLENRPEHVGVVLALLASGRCVVSLSPLQPDERLVRDVRACGLPAVVASPATLARAGVRDTAGEKGALIELTTSLEVVRAGGAVPADAVSGGGAVLEMLTSGTTGPPKRIRLGAAQLEQSLKAGSAPPPGEVVLRSGTNVVYTPLVHISGMWGALAPLYAGRRIALLPRFSLEPWLQAIETHRPRSSSAIPAVLRAILEADVAPERLASLRTFTSGTAPCPPDLADEILHRYGIRVLTTYGATEFAGAVAAWTLPLHERWWQAKRGSSGQAMPGVELRTVDAAAGHVLPPGEVGVLEVRAAQSVRGPDEWVRTSDLARVDADGFLFVEGRADDVIIRGGFKVHPSHVADALERHPAVRSAGVVPLPDERLGHVPAAGVELVPGATRPDPAELLELARATLLPYEVPVHVAVVDELPRTPSLKVSRPELLEVVLADMARTDGPAGVEREDAGTPAVS